MNTFEMFSLAVCFCALLVVSFFLSPLSHSEKSYPTTWRGFSSWIVDRVAMIAYGGHAGEEEKDEEDELKDEQ